MNRAEALKRLEALRPRGFTTRDAAALLKIKPSYAHMVLRRLADHGFLLHLRRGCWCHARGVSRFALPELLAAPYPAYVSMQSALYHHGLIDQVPEIVYAATLGRPRRLETPLATVSLHRLPPELFSGFEISPDDGVKIATAEKALFDVLYLAQGRSRLFARLPELEIPRGFRWKVLRRYVRLIKSPSRRGMVERRIERLAPPPPSPPPPPTS